MRRRVVVLKERAEYSPVASADFTPRPGTMDEGQAEVRKYCFAIQGRPGDRRDSYKISLVLSLIETDEVASNQQHGIKVTQTAEKAFPDYMRDRHVVMLRIAVAVVWGRGPSYW